MALRKAMALVRARIALGKYQNGYGKRQNASSRAKIVLGKAKNHFKRSKYGLELSQT